MKCPNCEIDDWKQINGSHLYECNMCGLRAEIKMRITAKPHPLKLRKKIRVGDIL